MKRKKNKGGVMTYDQAEARKDRGVEGLRRMGADDAADKLEDESVEDFAARKRITIVNPRKQRSAVSYFITDGPKSPGIGAFATKEQAEEYLERWKKNAPKMFALHPRKIVAAKNPRRARNVQGFEDAGGKFHPIRSSEDYDPRRTGESKGKSKKIRKSSRRRRRNPDQAEVQQARAMFEKFHGRASQKIQDIAVKQNDRRNLTGLGRLMYLQTADEVPIKFTDRDKVILACDPAGNQLYFVGGNQDISGILDQAGIDRSKDLIVVGECQYIIYTTDKDFDNFEEKDYQHEFGEESGELPVLMFDRLNTQLYLVGGAYQVKREGIVN